MLRRRGTTGLLLELLGNMERTNLIHPFSIKRKISCRQYKFGRCLRNILLISHCLTSIELALSSKMTCLNSTLQLPPRKRLELSTCLAFNT